MTKMVDQIGKTVDRVVVILTAAPTYIIAAGAVVSAASGEIVRVLPDDLGVPVVRWTLAIVAVLTSAIAVLRRVTSVIKEARGLLPIVAPIITADGSVKPVAPTIPAYTSSVPDSFGAES